jgi:hypothetical protein
MRNSGGLRLDSTWVDEDFEVIVVEYDRVFLGEGCHNLRLFQPSPDVQRFVVPQHFHFCFESDKNRAMSIHELNLIIMSDLIRECLEFFRRFFLESVHNAEGPIRSTYGRGPYFSGPSISTNFSVHGACSQQSDKISPLSNSTGLSGFTRSTS